MQLGVLEADPETELEVQGIYWGQQLYTEELEAGEGRGRSWTEMQASWSLASPARSSGAGTACHSVPCWAEMTGHSCPHLSVSLWHLLGEQDLGSGGIL